ncbi:MAG: NFACT RNA binding domain-containing protein, partial [Candidatus Gagatemarchaeaceae archaeon]
PGRRLLKGMPYVPPGQRRTSPASVDARSVREMALAEKTVGRAIGRHVSLPRKYIAEVLHRLSLQDDSPSKMLDGRESELVGVFGELTRQATEDPHPCLCEVGSGDEIFVIVPTAFKVKREASSLSSLCDELLLPEVLSKTMEEETPEEVARRELKTAIEKLKAEEEALVAEASKLRAAAREVAGASSGEGALALLKTMGIGPRKQPTSPAAAASLVYDRAKDLDAKASAVGKAIDRLVKKTPRKSGREEARTKKFSRRKQEWYEKFRWFRTSAGKLAIGGRDAHSNSTLVRRHLQDGDVAYHADLFGSPFFVLKGGKEQTDQEVIEVAQATVAFSSAWKTGLGTADAYWVEPSQVGTAAPSGEYLARGSFAIKGKKNFVTGNLVELAVGVDESGRVMAGPEAAISLNASRYVVMKPHREKGSETAKRVLNDLMKGTGERPFAIALDDVLRALPAGGGRVVRVSGGAQDRKPA